MESSGASPINESPTTQRKNPPAVVKRGLKSLFSSSGKFQKSIKRYVTIHYGFESLTAPHCTKIPKLGFILN